MRRGALAFLTVLLALSAGCVGAGPSRPPVTPRVAQEIRPVVYTTADPPQSSPYSPSAKLAFAKPSALTLDELLAMATRHNPDLAVAQSQVQAARGRLVQAGLYPNPVIGPRLDELGNKHKAWGSPGATINQEIVLANKLKLAQAAASHGVAAADWQAVSRWYEVVTRVRIGYYDVLTAEREVQTNQEIVELTQKILDVAKKLQKGGLGTKPDVLRAQVEWEQSRIRLAVAEKRREATWKILARVVGVPELPARELDGSIGSNAPALDWTEVLERMLVGASEIQAAHANAMQAEQLLRRARVEPIPNAQISVQPFYSIPDRDMMVEVVAGFAIPLFNRNQGNIAAAQAEVARSRAAIRQVELQLTEQLTNAFQRYQIAEQLVTGYRDKILPNARESLRLVQFAYEKSAAGFDLTALLQAQQTLVQARLQYVQAQGDLWRAVSEIRGLVQE